MASLKKTVETLQRDLDACRQEAAQLKASAQVCACARLHPSGVAFHAGKGL